MSFSPCWLDTVQQPGDNRLHYHGPCRSQVIKESRVKASQTSDFPDLSNKGLVCLLLYRTTSTSVLHFFYS